MKLFLLYTEVLPLIGEIYLNKLDIFQRLIKNGYFFLPNIDQPDLVFLNHNFTTISQFVIDKIDEVRNREGRILAYFHLRNYNHAGESKYSAYNQWHAFSGPSDSGPVVEALRHIGDYAGYEAEKGIINDQNEYIRGLFMLFNAFIRNAIPTPRIMCAESYRNLASMCRNRTFRTSSEMRMLYDRI